MRCTSILALPGHPVPRVPYKVPYNWTDFTFAAGQESAQTGKHLTTCFSTIIQLWFNLLIRTLKRIATIFAHATTANVQTLVARHWITSKRLFHLIWITCKNQWWNGPRDRLWLHSQNGYIYIEKNRQYQIVVLNNFWIHQPLAIISRVYIFNTTCTCLESFSVWNDIFAL